MILATKYVVALVQVRTWCSSSSSMFVVVLAQMRTALTHSMAKIIIMFIHRIDCAGITAEPSVASDNVCVGRVMCVSAST
jgi:hypothetical protein